MPLLNADWWRGPFVPLAPDEFTEDFAKRMRARERRVPFRRWRPVWQVQISDVSVNRVLAYSSLVRRDSAIRQLKTLPGNVTKARVIDVGTGEVVYEWNWA